MALLIFCKKINKNHIFPLKPNVFALSKRYYAYQDTETVDINVEKQAKYPPILSLTKEAIQEREKLAWHDAVKKLNTIEEKLLKVNMPCFYGLRTTPLRNDEYYYNCLPFIQHWTRTQFQTGLPSGWCKRAPEEIDGLVNKIKNEFIEGILFQYRYRDESELNEKLTSEEKMRLKTARICSDVNRILMNNLYSAAPHLIEAEVDVEPRHEAFWFVGGIEPPKDKKIWIERKVPLTEEEENAPIDRPFQYTGKPILAVRNQLPLEPVVESFVDDASFNIDEVPKSRCDPKSIGYDREYQHVKTIPGFWPGSEHEFGQLCYHNRHKYKVWDASCDPEDEKNALKAHGIVNSFGWLIAQAYYQGFSTFNDLTYPLTTQTIITDGQNWSFFLYQLNTTTFETIYFDKNRRVNKCWGTNEMKLFDEIDANGNLIGFNDDVLRRLVQFYVAAPKARDHEMKPYLGKDEQVIADIEDLKRREFLEDRFKHILSGRPRHRLAPELYMWERIYKVENQMMPIEPRRRFFELNIDPWARRLDEHHPKYIPKELRPEGPKSKKKWEETYWP